MFLAAKQLGSEAAKRDLGVKTKRCEDAKNHSLLRLKKFDLFRKIVDILSLVKRNILISPLEGEKKFLSELCELRNFREGYKKYKNKDCGTESAVTVFGANLMILFRGMHRSCIGRSALLCRQGKELSALVPQYLSTFSDTVFSRFTSHHSLKRKSAFTLAEVLITLGIIGVVAALTLPSVINNYKRKQLHTAFLRSSSLIQNALNETVFDYGYDNLKDFNKICDNQSKENNGSCRSVNKKLFEDISNDFISKFKVVKEMDRVQFVIKRIMTTNYSGMSQIGYKELYGITTYATPHAKAYLLSDGTLVSSISFFYHEPSDGLSFTFDTNGPFKGPNRYGYDIFLFNTGTWNKMCTAKQDGNIFNGRGCYDYALKDVNPDDKTKKYWDSLKF